MAPWHWLGARASAGNGALLEVVGIDNEPGMGGDTIIQATTWGVGGLGLPVYPPDAGRAGSGVDLENELFPDALTPDGGGCEQVLQVAGWFDPGRATMKQIVGQADQGRASLGDESKDRLGGVEEAAPGGLGHRSGERGSALASVEGVVAFPERKPGREVIVLYGPYGSRVGHRGIGG